MKPGQEVIVPDPNISDIHNHEFVGTIEEINGEIAVVSDQDDNHYEIELDRLTIY